MRAKTIHEAFWGNVRPEVGDACWCWAGSLDQSGYGMAYSRDLRGRKRACKLAHRLSWEIHYGEIPPNLCVCHRCDVPVCVRPDHLFLGTRDDNNKDRMRKGRGGSAKIAGERHFNASLTAHDVRAIRAAYAGGATKTFLGRTYGVTRQNILEVVARRTWKHVL